MTGVGCSVPDAEFLVAAARDLLDSAASKLSRPYLAEWPNPLRVRAATPRRLPVLRWLLEAANATVPATAALTSLLIQAAPTLPWGQTYTEADLGARFLARYGWTELIGLRGPVASTRLACGILMLAPETCYPLHCHEAEEIYLPLSGAALWRRGDGGWVRRPPGPANSSSILDSARHAHACRTTSGAVRLARPQSCAETGAGQAAGLSGGSALTGAPPGEGFFPRNPGRGKLSQRAA